VEGREEMEACGVFDILQNEEKEISKNQAV